MQQAKRRYSPLQLILISGALIVAALLLRELANILMLVFGAILIALLLSALADGICRISGISRAPSVALSILSVVLVTAAFVYFMGSQLVSEGRDLVERIPDLVATMENYVAVDQIREWIGSHASSLLGGNSFIGNLTGFSAGLFSISVNLVLVVSGGVYFAIHPQIYRDGFLALLPAEARPRAGEVLDEIAMTLKYWFIGQLASMACIGVVTTIGLLLLGIPSPFALGFLAGILEFVPYVGPIASAVPTVAVGLTEGPWTGLRVVLLYIVIQQAESILLNPLVQRKAVDLPPALIIFSIITFGALFGPGGIVLGTPLTVVAVILVKNFLRERDRRREAAREAG